MNNNHVLKAPTMDAFLLINIKGIFVDNMRYLVYNIIHIHKIKLILFIQRKKSCQPDVLYV